MKITKREYADSLHITVQELSRYMTDYLQSEGYDDSGNEYDTLDEYIAAMRRPASIHPDNRGAGGYDDNREQ